MSFYSSFLHIALESTIQVAANRSYSLTDNKDPYTDPPPLSPDNPLLDFLQSQDHG